MLRIIIFFLNIVLLPFTKRHKELLCKYVILHKNYVLAMRKLNQTNQKVSFKEKDRLHYVIIHKLLNTFSTPFTLVQPDTIMKWYRKRLKRFWTFPGKKKKIGRKPTPMEIKKLILDMKNNNKTWGVERIRGELLKLGHTVSNRTIRRILKSFRDKGKIKPTGSWSKFIKSHIDSLFACDFLTVDSILGIRYYLFFIIEIKTRKIVQFGIIQNPSYTFVRQQLIEFSWNYQDREKIYLIHDGSGELKYQNYSSLGITNIKIPASSPNCNAYAERFVGSIRREALDCFIIVGRKQLYNITKSYIDYYHKMRPHQGLEQQIPCGGEIIKFGEIKKESILGGLHHHYYRKAA